MPLSRGDRIGSYVVIARIGAGGMGEVYSARDTRLDRTVALKILSSELTADETFRERFTREARAIARLNHPNICIVYDAGDASVAGSPEPIQFLAMEYLDGETLVTRLARGPLHEQEALPIAMQLARALHQSHRAGLIHRDVKPANVMLTKSGAKLLDFGLAKHAAGTGPADLTTVGVVVGTISYMAPEQIAGRQVDARTDIFSLGSVIYEMLTGKRCFDGLVRPDVGVDAIAGISPSRIGPSAVDRIVGKCLAVDPDDRWQSAADLATALEWVGHPADPQGGRATSRPRPIREIVAWSLVVMLGLVAALSVIRNDRAAIPSGISKRFALALPDLQPVVGDSRSFALLPDGSGIAYLGGSATAWHIQIHTFADGVTRKLPETDNARLVSVSPDGKWIAFRSATGLRKVAIDGGSPVRVCEAARVTGITWIGNDWIVFSDDSGLRRVPAAGGEPEGVTRLDSGELRHVSPHALPGGDAVLFTVQSQSGAAEDTAIHVVSLGTRQRNRLLPGGTDARYSPSQHLVYVRQSDVMAVGFDTKSLQLRGTPFLALPGIHVRAVVGGMFDLAADGTFVYAGLGDLKRTLVWVDRRRTETALPVPHRGYGHPALLPDERSLIIELDDAVHNLWQVDLTTGALTRLTDDTGNHRPVASPDGKFVAFSSDRTKPRSLFRQLTDGSGEPQRLTTSTTDQNVTSWSHDGRWLAFDQTGPTTQGDIWLLPLDGERTPRPFLQTRYAERSAVFSPDGQWIAYASDESGRSEVMIRAFSDAGPRKQVSIAGGQTPAFSSDGKTLYYRMNNQIWAAAISTDSTLTIGAPTVAFELPGVPGLSGLPNYVVNRSGDRVLAVKYLGDAGRPHDLQVVINWFDVLRRASAQQ